ncbi:MAG: oligosaccharide flippase family protein, partial [Patescibacteria group bacterium]|nr:oligosaccharide flippase family protein [Patescibacteria group bacterium]
FGLYTTAFAIVMIVIDAVELAISGSIIKFASQADTQSQGFVKFGFYLKLILGLVITALFILISQVLSPFLHPLLTYPLLIVSLFIPAVFLLRFPKSLLQSQKKFFKDTVLEIITSLIRLASIFGFYWLAQLTVITALLSYLFGALAAFLIGALMISWKFLSAPPNPKIKSHFFSFQKWLTVGFIIAAVHGRIDSVILLKFSGPEATGIYQAAFRFFMPVLQLAGALSLVFAPRFASFPDFSQKKTYLHKAAKLALGLGSLVLLFIPLAPFMVKFIFGAKYLSSILPLQILSLGFAAFVAGAPYTSHLIYAVNKTKIFFLVNLLQLAFLVSLDLILIPLSGAVGAAWALASTLIIINGLLATIALTAKV